MLGPELIAGWKSRDDWQTTKASLAVGGDADTWRRAFVERYHRTFRQEGWQGAAPADFPAALALITEWVQTYNTVRLHSALQYLTPWDYYRGDPVMRITHRRTKLQTARTRRREAWEAYHAAAHPAA